MKSLIYYENLMNIYSRLIILYLEVTVIRLFHNMDYSIIDISSYHEEYKSNRKNNKKYMLK
jgi:hypothetical protein